MISEILQQNALAISNYYFIVIHYILIFLQISEVKHDPTEANCDFLIDILKVRILRRVWDKIFRDMKICLKYSIILTPW